MNQLSHKSDVFYIPGVSGNLLAVYTSPKNPRHPTEHVVIVPPFSEEMNRVRRIVSLQARQFASIGVGTLVVDLYGTGDSEGVFRDARWNIWKSDIGTVVNWLRKNCSGKISLLGIRLGALLAMDFARGDNEVEKIILWQPVISGSDHIREFLLIRVLAGMMQKSLSKQTIEDLRAALNRGESVEVDGYEVNPELINEIDQLNIEFLRSKDLTPIHWMEVSRTLQSELKPVSQNLIHKWKSEGFDTNQYMIKGHTFWMDGKVKVAHELLDITTEIFKVP